MFSEKYYFLNREVKIMREGIHPEYHQATVTCNCGNTFVTGSTNESAIRSTQDSRKLHRHADVLTSSTRSMVSNKKHIQQAEIVISACYCI